MRGSFVSFGSLILVGALPGFGFLALLLLWLLVLLLLLFA
jgi:hypothetical protein